MSVSTTSAVITLATLAAGIGCSLPDVAIAPSPLTPIAAEPMLGHGSWGASPAITVWTGSDVEAEAAGIVRK